MITFKPNILIYLSAFILIIIGFNIIFILFHFTEITGLIFFNLILIFFSINFIFDYTLKINDEEIRLEWFSYKFSFKWENIIEVKFKHKVIILINNHGKRFYIYYGWRNYNQLYSNIYEKIKVHCPECIMEDSFLSRL